MATLSIKRQQFAQEVAVGVTYTDAAAKVGYKCPRVKGSELAAMPEVAAEIARLRAENSERYKHTTERLIEWLAAIVYGDTTQLYDPAGVPLPPHQVPPHLRTLLDRDRPVGMRERQQAAKLLATITGATPTKVELSGTVGLRWEDIMAGWDDHDDPVGPET